MLVTTVRFDAQRVKLPPRAVPLGRLESQQAERELVEHDRAVARAMGARVPGRARAAGPSREETLC